ncbi:OmpA family protein [Desulfosarcina cetonica]|uniref:OmpA family protein n=1 Tax=Desulfosarcina cetonica TaxID=90730 RepID=UPI00155DA362|nr:OmpA family protein [Desulfosarcina cetonica]
MGDGRLLVLIGIAMSGCASPLATGTPRDTAGLGMPTGDPAASVKALAADMADTRVASLDLLSPDWFAQAEAACRSPDGAGQRSTGRRDPERRDDGPGAPAQGRSGGHDLAPHPGPGTQARDLARQAGAAENAKTYRKVETQCLALARAIERDNLAYAEKNRGKVIDAYRKLEIEAIRSKALGPAKARLAEARDAGARRLAPQTDTEAVDALDAAAAFIAANRGARDEIQARADKALFQADRLMAVAQSSRRFKAMAPEEAALFLETALHGITTHLGAPDMRDEDTQTQLENIIGTIDALKNDRGFLSQQNQTLQSKLTDLQARLDALNIKMALLENKSRQDQMAKEQMLRERVAAEQRLKLAQCFETVQGYFSSKEAEVHREEDRVVIRLKGMRFAVGKSTIRPASYRLLGKLQKAIRSFDSPRVIVEGHTDATGSAEANMRLSQARADAVRDYLIKNQTLPADNISAVGHGAARPIAANTTAAGRAINRRIDIVITPRTNPM